MSFHRAFALLVVICTVVLLFLGLGIVVNLPGIPHIRQPQVGKHTSGAAADGHVAERSISDIGGRKLHLAVEEEMGNYSSYSAVLDKHTFNRTNILSFKKDFFHGQTSNNLVADQINAPVGSKLVYFHENKTFFNVSEEFHSRLPKAVNMSHLGKCTVVGSSGIIVNSSCGENIDRSDFVFRCNAAPIESFLKDAGRKTNLTSFNPSIWNRRYGRLKEANEWQRFVDDMQEYNGFIMGNCFGLSSSFPLCVEVLKNYSSGENVFTMGHPNIVTDMRREWTKRGLESGLSTGLFLTTAALKYCDEVHLYGFWPFRKVPTAGDLDVPYHYYDDIGFPEEYSFKRIKPHNMNKEFAFLVRMHALGIIRMHVNPCTYNQGIQLLRVEESDR